MSMHSFGLSDILAIRTGSQEFNEKKEGINHVVKTAIGMVSGDQLVRFQQGEAAMSVVCKGIRWEVTKYRNRLHARADRNSTRTISDSDFLYDSTTGVNMPLDEIDSVWQSLPMFVNELAKYFPSIYPKLMMLRAAGQAASRAARARKCFMLSKEVSLERRDHLGIVIATDIQEAARILELQLTEWAADSGNVFGKLVDSGGSRYTLESYLEISVPIKG